MNTIQEMQEEYEQIMRLPEGDVRDRALGNLMTRMEREYLIPAMQDQEWENAHKAVITMYRKLSMGRSF